MTGCGRPQIRESRRCLLQRREVPDRRDRPRQTLCSQRWCTRRHVPCPTEADEPGQRTPGPASWSEILKRTTLLASLRVGYAGTSFRGRGANLARLNDLLSADCRQPPPSDRLGAEPCRGALCSWRLRGLGPTATETPSCSAAVIDHGDAGVASRRQPDLDFRILRREQRSPDQHQLLVLLPRREAGWRRSRVLGHRIAGYRRSRSSQCRAGSTTVLCSRSGAV
jgi:hypothetical protein